MLLHWCKSLFIDELLVLIQPKSIVLLRLHRVFKHGFKQQVVHQQVIDLPQRLSVKSNTESDWKLLSQYLAQALQNSKWQGAMSSVILANHFVRYTIIPWNTELAIESERQAYLQHCFNLAYGESANTWHLQMSAPSFGQSAMASAVNHDLLAILHEVFSQAGMKLAAVSPQLMLAMNQAFSQFKKQSKNQAPSFWLVAIQSERVCLTLLQESGWRLVKNVAIETDVSAQVLALMQREAVHCNMNADLPVLLYWPDCQSVPPLTLANINTISVLPHLFDLQNNPAFNQQFDGVLI